MHTGMRQTDLIVFSELLRVDRRGHIIVTDLFGIVGRRFRIRGKGNFVAQKFRRSDDLEPLVLRHGNQFTRKDKLARRAHALGVNREQPLGGRMPRLYLMNRTHKIGMSE